jgi:hypothetical protein
MSGADVGENQELADGDAEDGQDGPDDKKSKPLGVGGRIGLGVLLVLEIAAAVYVLFAVWGDVAKIPQPSAVGATTKTNLDTVHVFGYHWTNPSADSLYFVAVMVLASLGSAVHALTKFGTYQAKEPLTTDDTWWYVVRLPVGVALALVFYFVIRGGLLSVDTSTGAISPYGIGAIAGLIGLFSKQAVDKLLELFMTLFQVGGTSAGAAPSGSQGVAKVPSGVPPPAAPPMTVAKAQAKGDLGDGLP